MSIVKEPPKFALKSNYKDFDFEVGITANGDYVKIKVKPEALPKIEGSDLPQEFFIELVEGYDGQLLYDGKETGKYSESKLFEDKVLSRFVEKGLFIENNDGLVMAINESLKKMRQDPKYTWKEE